MQLPGFGDTSDLQTYTALPPLVFEDSEYLFLMTMPSFDSEARKFYFADSGNHFWKVMAAIYKMPAETSEERTALCKANKIAIWSVLKSCKRHLSQQDTTTDEVYNDMAGFLKEHPTIKKLICVSRMAEHEIDRENWNFPADVQVCYVPSPSGADFMYEHLDELVPLYARALDRAQEVPENWY